MGHLLLVEDDATIGALLASALRANGHTVTWQRTGASALADVTAAAPDLVLLDLGLPDMDGVAVCRDLRATLPHAVIVMLTARSEEMDIVVGLEAGADDYLTKPFGLTAMLARVRAHLRRGAPGAELSDRGVGETYEDGDLCLDTAARRCQVGGADVDLRPREFDLLARLVRSVGHAVSRETLMADVWDENWFGSSKTLDVHVAALRRRLSQAAAKSRTPVRLPTIQTLRRHGYRLDPTRSAPDPRP